MTVQEDKQRLLDLEKLLSVAPAWTRSQ